VKEKNKDTQGKELAGYVVKMESIVYLELQNNPYYSENEIDLVNSLIAVEELIPDNKKDVFENMFETVKAMLKINRLCFFKEGFINGLSVPMNGRNFIARKCNIKPPG
jgi:hypothetical protein